MAKVILVTGSSGTVGTAVVRELRRQRYGVIPLDIKRSLWDGELNRRTIFHDLRKPLRKDTIRRKPTMILHLAANARVHDLVVDPGQARDNYLMTHNLLEYARENGIKQFVFSSSREVYGESTPGESRQETDTHVTAIKSPYTASKFAAEALIHAYHECYGIKPVIIRLSNVYGRYDVSERVVPLFMYYARRDRSISVFGRDKRLDFTFIDDCADGIVRVVKRFNRVGGMTFNISSGRGERLLDLARLIVREMGSESKITISRKRVGEISAFVGDISLARKHLGYKPEVTLERGVPRAIKWYTDAIRDRRVYDTQRRNLAARGWA